MSDPKTRHERGLDVMQTLTDSTEAGSALAEYFDRQGALGSFALNTGAGEIWSRPGLARRDRSLVVISFLTALGREIELPSHIAGGLNHGLSRDEIDEIMGRKRDRRLARHFIIEYSHAGGWGAE